MGCDRIAVGLWIGLAFVCTIVVTLAFATGYWVEVSETEETFGYENIHMGLIYSCITYDGTETCGQYGNGLSDIPITSWRSAALFYGCGVFLGWATCLMALFSFCSDAALSSLRHFMTASCALTTLGLLIFAGNLGALKYDQETQSAYSYCQGAGPFDAGSNCKLGDSGVIACVGLGLALMSTVSSHMITRQFKKDDSANPQEGSIAQSLASK